MQISISNVIGRAISLGSYASKLIKAFKERVLSYPNSIFEAELCLNTTLKGLNTIGLLDNASLVITPNSYSEGKLYDVVPNTTLGDMDVVRATTATRVNEQGLIEVVPRNLLTYSNDFTNATWTKNNATVTSNNIISPDGTLNASLITSTDTSAAGIYSLPNLNGTNTWSFYGKKGTARYIFLNTNVPLVAAKFDLQDGVVIGTTGVEAIASIQSVGNDWYRCIITSSISIDRFTIFITNNTTVTDISSSVGLNFYLYGTQLEQGSTATTYFPTTTRLNIPRIDYTNGSCPSLLVEPQRTNLASYSEQFDNAYWNVYNTTVTANTTISPDGTQNADTFVFDAVTTARLERAIGGAYENNTLTVSVYAKVASGTSQFRLKCTHASVADYFSSDLTVTTEWQRFTFTQTFGSTVGSGAVFGMLNSTNGTTKTIQFYGAQLEVGSYATSYIPTVASTVTRNADVISKTGISSLIGQTEGTLFVDAYITGKNTSDGSILLATDELSSGAIIRIFYTSNNALRFDIYNGSSFQCQISAGAYNVGDRVKIAGAYKNNDFIMYVNGTQIGTDTSGSVPATDTININNSIYGDGNGSFIQAAALWKTRLTNTELAQLTTI